LIGRRLGNRDRRALLLALTLLTPTLGFSLVGRPVAVSLTETYRQVATQRELLSRELGLLAGAGQFAPAFDHADTVLRERAPRLFGGDDEVMLTARLASYVGDQARLSRVLLHQSEAGAAVEIREGVIALQLDLRGIGDLEAILDLLRRFETGSKLVRVERLAIERSERLWTGGAEPGEALAIAASLRGFALRRLPASSGDRDVPEIGLVE
jgi:hypothetical protein